VTFAAAGLFEYLLIGPVEITEVVGEQNAGKESGSTGAATHAKRDFVVELKMEAGSENANIGEDVNVGREDEVVFELRAKSCIAAGGVNVEVLSRNGVDGEVEGHGETESVEARTEIGGGRGEAEAEGLALDGKRSGGGHAGWGWFI
jgi:hypothetical protein